MAAAVRAIARADELLLRAVRDVESGDILGAVINVQQAKITASSGVAITKSAIEMSETLLDILD